MKKLLILAILFHFVSLHVAGQDKKVDSVVNKWKAYFNKQDHQNAYAMYSSFYKDKVSLENLSKSLRTIYGMMGTLKAIKYVSFNGQYYKYQFFGQKHEVEADVIMVIDTDYKFHYFNIESIGGKGDPPPIGKMQ